MIWHLYIELGSISASAAEGKEVTSTPGSCRARKAVALPHRGRDWPRISLPPDSRGTDGIFTFLGRILT